MTIEPVRIGLIGCGNISDTYFQNARLFPGLRIVACADRAPELALAQAARYGVRALSPDALLAERAIDIVLNLTPPAAHAEVGRAVLCAGKHLYTEKPLCTRFADAQALLAQAHDAGLQVACAPDTVFGAAHQQARQLVDSGAIGRVLAGSAAVMDRGMEAWHPNPAFFFQPGGGPVLDMGPYYLTSLVSLLGPAARVSAVGTRGWATRSVGSGPRQGQSFAVEVPTTVHAAIEFDSGANISLSASWDVWRHGHPHIELYGSEGSLVLPDPNWFGGALSLALQGAEFHALPSLDHALGRANRADGTASVADYRIVGLADMAQALRERRPPRAAGALGLHVLEIMEAIATAAAEARHVALQTRAERPAPLPAAEVAGWMQPGAAAHRPSHEDHPARPIP